MENKLMGEGGPLITEATIVMGDKVKKYSIVHHAATLGCSHPTVRSVV